VSLRSTAHLLVVVMLLAQGRLLACGWECLDEMAAAAAEPSCHEASDDELASQPTVAVVMVGEGAHPCLPDVTEPTVTVAKTVKAQLFAAAPSVALFVDADGLGALSRERRQASGHRSGSPHSRAPFVLRI
jgi:hypothetical protein